MVAGVVEAMRGQEDWGYVLLVRKSVRSNIPTRPTNIQVGTVLKAQVQVDGAKESVEFSCKETDSEIAWFLSEEVIWGK